MAESQLKREFKERDVQRMRNIITKNYSDKTSTQVGYTKQDIIHKEGDIWEENNKTWIIKNGLKQTITKMDNFRKIMTLPLICPKCHTHMKNDKLNKQMYSLHNMCFDCVIIYETELKRSGLFEDYQKNINKQGMKVHLKEMEILLLELSMSISEESFTTEAGDIEVWKGNNNNTNELIKGLQEYINTLKDIIEQ